MNISSAPVKTLRWWMLLSFLHIVRQQQEGIGAKSLLFVSLPQRENHHQSEPPPQDLRATTLKIKALTFIQWMTVEIKLTRAFRRPGPQRCVHHRSRRPGWSSSSSSKKTHYYALDPEVCRQYRRSRRNLFGGLYIFSDWGLNLQLDGHIPAKRREKHDILR